MYRKPQSKDDLDYFNLYQGEKLSYDCFRSFFRQHRAEIINTAIIHDYRYAVITIPFYQGTVEYYNDLEEIERNYPKINPNSLFTDWVPFIFLDLWPETNPKAYKLDQLHRKENPLEWEDPYRQVLRDFKNTHKKLFYNPDSIMHYAHRKGLSTITNKGVLIKPFLIPN